MSSVPVLSYGRHAHIAEAVGQRLKPEYDVVHSCVDFSAALSEIPTILSGDLSVAPASGLGSNTQRVIGDRRAPKAVVFGALIPPEEVQQIKDAVAVKGVETVWIKINPADIKAPATGNVLDSIVPECKRLLKDAGL